MPSRFHLPPSMGERETSCRALSPGVSYSGSNTASDVLQSLRQASPPSSCLAIIVGPPALSFELCDSPPGQ